MTKLSTPPASIPDAEADALPPARAIASRGWWRTNLAAVVVTLILAVTTVVFTSYKEWSDYFGYRAVQPVTVDESAPIDFGGATWRVEPAAWLTAAEKSSLTLPPSTEVVLVRVWVEPTAIVPPGCLVELQESGGSSPTRVFSPTSDFTIDLDVTPGAVAYCPTDAAGPYLLEVPFVLPNTVDGDLTLQVSVAEELPRFLSISVPAKQ